MVLSRSLRRPSSTLFPYTTLFRSLLDEQGNVVRDALLWNDTRSAPQAEALIEEMGGPEACVEEIGSLMVASFTATKLRWVRDNEPDNAERARSVTLPHDHVSLHLPAHGP